MDHGFGEGNAQACANGYLVDSKLESLQNGERLLEHAVSLDKNFVDAYALLAQNLAFQGSNFFANGAANIKRSEAAALNAVRINPHSAEVAPRLLQYKPEEVIDGDAAAWTAGMYALLGEKQQALIWLRRAIALGDVNYPWYSKDKNCDSLRGDPAVPRDHGRG